MSPKEVPKDTPNARSHSHFSVGPNARERVGGKGMSIVVIAQSFPGSGERRWEQQVWNQCCGRGEPRAGLGGRDVPSVRAQHRLREHSPALCITNCFCRQAGCL